MESRRFDFAGLLSAILVLAMLFVPLTGCASGLRQAQTTIAPISFEHVGLFDGQAACNSHVLAVDATVDLTIRIRHGQEVVWEASFSRGTGRRAYQVVVQDDGSIEVLAISWEQARAFLPWLPGDAPTDARNVGLLVAEP